MTPDFKPHAVEYIQLRGSERLPLRAKGHKTRCGIAFKRGKFEQKFFRNTPDNACQNCLSFRLTRSADRVKIDAQ